MQYYYLDGPDKKGPYSKGQLKELNLSYDTFVYSNELGEWKKIKDIPELITYFEKKEEELTKSNPILTTPSQPVKTKINIFLFLTIILILSIGLSFFITQYQRKTSFEEIKKEIDNCFKGNESISDYDVVGENSGEFHKLKSVLQAKINSFSWLNYSPNEMGFFKTRSTYDEKGNFKGDSTFFKVVGDLTKTKKISKIVDYFDVESKLTDRNLSILKRETNLKFSFKNITFLDLAYLVPENEYYDYGYGVKGSIPTYRPSVSKVYSDAAKFILNNEGATYEKGSSDKIWEFDEIETDFYKIGVIFPYSEPFPLEMGLEIYNKRDRYKALNLYSLIRENGDYTFVSYHFENEMYKEPWFSNTKDMYMTENSSISDSETIVWYCESTNKYEIREKEWVFYKLWSIYSAILFLMIAIIYFIWKKIKNYSIF